MRGCNDHVLAQVGRRPPDPPTTHSQYAAGDPWPNAACGRLLKTLEFLVHDQGRRPDQIPSTNRVNGFCHEADAATHGFPEWIQNRLCMEMVGQAWVAGGGWKRRLFLLFNMGESWAFKSA
jgi:hypothetical protein